MSVYLTEDVETCLAERMFYFHREVLTALDRHHIVGVLPPFQQTFVLWEVRFAAAVQHVADLTVPNAPAAFNVFPSLMSNPSQDYWHLKQGRAGLQGQGYLGLRAPSARARHGGNMVVLFNTQQGNVAAITPHQVVFRLLRTRPAPMGPFANHAADVLNYESGEVSFPGGPNFGAKHWAGWHTIDFHH